MTANNENNYVITVYTHAVLRTSLFFVLVITQKHENKMQMMNNVRYIFCEIIALSNWNTNSKNYINYINDL